MYAFLKYQKGQLEQLVFHFLSKNKFPFDGRSINDKIFNNVDFPDPEGPTRE